MKLKIFACMLSAMCLFGGVQEAVADGGKTIKGPFRVDIEGHNSEGRKWSKRVERVDAITFVGDFVILQTRLGGLTYNSATVDSIRWINTGSATVPTPPVKSVPNKAELKRKEQAFFKKLEKQLDAHDFDALYKTIVDFENFLASINEWFGHENEFTLRIKKRFKDHGFAEIKLALDLQEAVTEGNKMVRSMREAKDKGDSRRVWALYRGLEKHCASMKTKKQDAFTRNANALLSAGKRIRDGR